MKSISWATDIHLDFLKESVHEPGGGMTSMTTLLSEKKVKAFCDEVASKNTEALVITGDISTGDNLEYHLNWLGKHLPIPVYFVLGNHDFYNSTILRVRANMRQFDGSPGKPSYLSNVGVVQLSEESALVGHDGWYDGGYSDWFKSKLVMTDYYLIGEMRFEVPTKVWNLMQELSFQGRLHARKHLTDAAERGFKEVYFATHVPPFRENSRAPDGSLSDPNWLPNMSCKMLGDELLDLSKKFPGTNFICLSGHTHTAYQKQYAENLWCFTGKAKYGNPESSIQVLDIK